jgi:hypothetical protein
MSRASKSFIAKASTFHYGSAIVVTNATHVAASASELGCLESSCLVRMLTTPFLIPTTVVMVRVRFLVIVIQK